MRTTFASVIVVAMLGCGVFAQQTPARDAPAPAPSGTALVAGHVMSGDATPRPLRRALVQMTGANLRSPRLAMTDDDGGFAVTGLAPGQYSIIVTKVPYLQVQYGQRRPGRGIGTPITLTAGQRVTSIVIAMPRGAVISGTVRDASGRPAANLPVRLFEIRSVEGERLLVGASLAQSGLTTTDDRGMYRLYAVPPGEYTISATPVVNPQDLRVTESDEITWSEQQWQSARGGGAPQASVRPPSAGRTVGYSAVYFPGTTDPSSAMPITVAAGEERLGVDIALQLVPTAKIDGLILWQDGKPAANISVFVMPFTPGVQVQTQMVRSTDRDGKFSFPGLIPGTYRIGARSTSVPISAAPPGSLLVSRQGDAAFAKGSVWAQADVTVAGQDVVGVSMTLMPSMTVSGRVVMEGATEPLDLTRARISFSSASPMTMAGAISPTLASPDGTFSVDGFDPGRFRVIAGSMQLGQPLVAWTLKSAVVNGKDVLDSYFDVRPGENVSDMVLTYSNRPTELSGYLLDGDSKPATGYVMLLFSTDRAMWTQSARRTRQIRPAEDGKFVLSLPAGDYYMTAVTDVVPADLYDWRFLADLAASAIKVTLADGEKKRQDLKLAR